MNIRLERTGDETPIEQLTRVAFETQPHSDGSEPAIIERLRAAGDLHLSLVVELNERIVGHVASSPITIDGRHEGWFGLGPVSVDPAVQRQGIGKSLMLEGLRLLREGGATGVALLGDPAIYSRVGFKSNGDLRYGEFDPRLVQHITFKGDAPQGEVQYAPGFG